MLLQNRAAASRTRCDFRGAVVSGPRPEMAAGLGSRIAAGVAWMVVFKLLDRSIGIVSVVILARLLVPADFGLVAMATATIAVIELLSAFNFDMALIQRQEATRAHYDTAWTLNVAMAAGCALLVAAAAVPAGA